MNGFVLRFQYTKEEFVRAYRAYLFLNKTLTPLLLWVLGGALVGAGVLMAILGVSAVTLGALFTALVMALVVFAIYFVHPPALYKRNPRLALPYDIAVEADGLHYRTKGEKGVTPYTAFRALWETPTFVYLIQGKNMYVLLPKRAFQNEEQCDTLAAFARQAYPAMSYKRFEGNVHGA